MLSAVKCSALTAKTRDFVKKLEINVPDQRHLKLVYVYTGSPAMMRTLRTMAIKSMCSIIYHLTQTALL